MNFTKHFRACLLPVILISGCTICLAQAANYDDMIQQARALLKEEKPIEAKTKADEAAKLDPKRYEAFAVVALIAVKQGDTVAGKVAVAKALLLAPVEKKASLEALQKKLVEPGPESPSESATAPAQRTKPAAATNRLTGEVRRKYDALLLVIEDADKAKSAEERKRLLREFMNKSTQIMASYPDLTNIWILRAAIACEIKQSIRGWQAGQRLKAWGLENSSDPKIGRVFAMLERNSWLGQLAPGTTVDETDQEIRRLAEEGDSWFQLILGRIYDSQIDWRNRSIPTNDVAAVKWYLEAAKQGDTFAQSTLGSMYCNGRGVAKDKAEGVKWYRRAADRGDSAALDTLIAVYLGGFSRDEAGDAVRALRTAAEAGRAYAQFYLGSLYEYGCFEVVSKDEDEAVRWYRKAADNGNPDGRAKLEARYGVAKSQGRMDRNASNENLVSSMDDSRTNGQAVDTFPERLAEAQGGYVMAQMDVGRRYWDGDGVPKDEVEAVKWYCKAAEAGNAGAQLKLIHMYTPGQGAGKDAAEALNWWRKLGEKGELLAQENLGTIYEEGVGVPKDIPEAVRWYRKAADGGNCDAQYHLGLLYEHGVGVPQDKNEALKWYRQATKYNADAQTALKRLEAPPQ
jgi:uncharacterized protein